MEEEKKDATPQPTSTVVSASSALERGAPETGSQVNECAYAPAVGRPAPGGSAAFERRGRSPVDPPLMERSARPQTSAF